MNKIIFNYHPGSPTNAMVSVTNPNGETYLTAKTNSMVFGGQHMDLINIHDIDVSLLEHTNKESLPMIQMFDCGYREALRLHQDDEEVYQHWNGCVFVDIDTKKYHGIKEKELHEKFQTFVEYSSANLSWASTTMHNFYFAQISHSGTSAHFVFFFNCEKTSINFRCCTEFATEAIKKQIRALMPGDSEGIIGTKGVIDSCNLNPTQPLFMSKFPIIISSLESSTHFGDCDVTKFTISDNIDDLDNGVIVSDVEFNRNGNERLCDIKNMSKDWSHPKRWALLKIFCSYFQDDKKSAIALYKDFIPKIKPYIHNHTEKDLERLFNSQYNNTLREIKRGNTHYTNLSHNLMRFCKEAFNMDFRIRTKFIPKRIEYTDYDEAPIELKEGETIADKIDYLFNLEKNLIHIEAGCGLGKTYSAKEFVRANSTIGSNGEIMCNKRICFVSPMTSINSANFEDEESSKYWTIVDSKHKDYDAKKMNEKSVCTTWDSFCHQGFAYEQFDLFVFDEAHSLYMYDYRTAVISRLLNDIKKIIQDNKKVIFFTGTPSRERELYKDRCWKVKVFKETTKVKANIIIYNNSFWGHLYEDIRHWIEGDPKNCAVIYYDKANQEVIEQFARRGISIDTMYNKQFSEDVDRVNREHSFFGKVTLVSVYGQAGINVYAADDQYMRVYVLCTNAMSIIQYSNRIRNKAFVESINIYYKNDNISNKVRQYDSIDEPAVLKKVEHLNSLYCNQSLCNISERVININFGLSKEYIEERTDSNNRRVFCLNQDHYFMYESIRAVSRYESQLPIIYNRLLDAYYDIKIDYMEEDVKDVYNSKMKSNFVGQLVGNKFLNSMTNSKGTVTLDTDNNSTLKKYMVGETETNINRIFEYYVYEYRTSPHEGYTDELTYVRDKWTGFIKEMFKRSKDGATITKTDIKDFCEVIKIKRNRGSLEDKIIIYYLKQNEEKADNNLFLGYAANYATMTYSSDMDWALVCETADEAYKAIKRLHKLISKFRWFYSWDDMTKECTLSNENMCNYQLRDRIYTYLLTKHSGFCRNSKQVQVVRGGIIVAYYNSMKEASNALQLSEKTIKRYCNTGHVCKKLNAVLILT